MRVGLLRVHHVLSPGFLLPENNTADEPEGFVRRFAAFGLAGYFGASFGGTPITLTPAPRATSIAQITS